MNQKRKPNPPRVCCFCGGRPISKEHIIPKWMHVYLSEMPGGKTHQAELYRVDGDSMESISNSRKYQAGDVRGHGTKSVCKQCNNGWLSQIQNDTKHLVGPLVQGESMDLTYEQRAQLSTWISMMSIVIETMDPKTMGVSQEQREFLMHRLQVPPNWGIWIGKTTEGHNWFHRGASVGQVSRERSMELGSANCNIQATYYAVGEFCFVAISGSDVSLFREFHNAIWHALRLAGFAKFWPFTQAGPLPLENPVDIKGGDLMTFMDELFGIS